MEGSEEGARRTPQEGHERLLIRWSLVRSQPGSPFKNPIKSDILERFDVFATPHESSQIDLPGRSLANPIKQALDSALWWLCGQSGISMTRRGRELSSQRTSLVYPLGPSP